MPNILHLLKDHAISYLHCNRCGKQVSTGFYPIPTDTPDRGIVIRAWIECPECIEAQALGEPRILPSNASGASNA